MYCYLDLSAWQQQVSLSGGSCYPVPVDNSNSSLLLVPKTSLSLQLAPDPALLGVQD